MAQQTNVFISYSHKDQAWLKRLQVHLKPLERDGLIDRWDDTRIQSGEKWADEIRDALAAAGAAILLISADFLASDFIAEKELPPLLAAAENERVVILPMILSPSRFTKTQLSQFQAVNAPERPLIKLERWEQEEILARVAEAVETALSKPTHRSSTSGHGSTTIHAPTAKRQSQSPGANQGRL